jgi:hypothetical protein
MNRGQPMQRGGRIKPKKRGAADFARIYGSPQRLEWVKALPCLARELLSRPGECEGEIQNAHSVVGGMGYKAGAETIVPLCVAHHMAYDRYKPPFDDPAIRDRVQAEAERVAKAWLTLNTEDNDGQQG